MMTRIICRRQVFLALRLALDHTKLTGRLQKIATTQRKTIDEYKIAAWSSLGAGATVCSGGATGGYGRAVIVAITPEGKGRRRRQGGEDGNVKPAGVDEGLCLD
jgi:hypothetical protein